MCSLEILYQLRLIYYATANRNITTLDYGSLVFRNLNFGVITPTVKGGRSCGVDKIQQCGNFNPQYTGVLNSTSLHIHMQPVPGCPAEEKPFSLHGAGPFKRELGLLVKDLRAVSDEL